MKCLCGGVITDDRQSCKKCGMMRYKAKCGHVVTDDGDKCQKCGVKKEKATCGHVLVNQDGNCCRNCKTDAKQNMKVENTTAVLDDGHVYREVDEKFDGPGKNAQIIQIPVGEILGLMVSKRHATIKCIEDGAVKKWNEAHARRGFQVEVGDIMWQVTLVDNGTFSKQPLVPDIMAMLKSKVSFAVKFRKKNGTQEKEAFGGKVATTKQQAKKKKALQMDFGTFAPDSMMLKSKKSDTNQVVKPTPPNVHPRKSGADVPQKQLAGPVKAAAAKRLSATRSPRRS